MTVEKRKAILWTASKTFLKFLTMRRMRQCILALLYVNNDNEYFSYGYAEPAQLSYKFAKM